MRRTPRPRFALALLVLAGAAALAAYLAFGARRATAPPAVPSVPPDLLLVTIDTWRADALGAAGNAEASTPTLDRLAAAGRLFTNAHAHNVVTLPSHTNILTGRLPYEHGVRDNDAFRLAPEIPTLATLLKPKGYATAAFVAAFPLDSRFGLAAGFDLYDDRYPLGSKPDQFVMAERHGDQVVQLALAWWQSHAASPRFLWVHLYEPHAPYAPPEPFLSRFRDRPYLGEVAAADSYLAALLDPFIDGRERAALVVVTADHGEGLGDHGELTHGLFAYEATLKVPLLLWGAGVAPGRDGRAARHVDIVPTFLAAAGLAPPPELIGRSLLAVPDEAAASYFEALSTSLNRGWAPLRGMLLRGSKFIDLPIPELYHLEADPGETKNRVADERRLANELRAAIQAESSLLARREESDDEAARALGSLGYLGGRAPAKSAYGPEDDPKNLLDIDRDIHALIVAYQGGDFASAARVGRSILSRRPSEAEVYDSTALALRQLERQDEAIVLLRSAIDRGLGSEPLRRTLALTLCEVGRPREAVEILGPFEASSSADTVNALAIALSDAGENDRAAGLLERQAVATPEDPQTLENLGIVLLRLGRAGDAVTALRRALASNGDLAISWNTLGVALYQINDRPGALAAWRQAVRIDARQLDALYNLGWVALESGQPAEARRALEEFVRKAPPGRFAAELEKARALLATIRS